MPEMEEGSGYKYSPAVRDFPIDYTILVENICDADHGLFAHQQAAFDMYTASQDDPQRVEVVEDPPNGGSASFAIYGEVSAVKALTASTAVPPADRDAAVAAALRATTRFVPPCNIQICRRNASGHSKFITAFWVVPVGVGRSRFLSVGVGSVKIPRWLQHIGLNNFLDQDTYLLATQQPHVLAQEWAAQVEHRERSLDGNAKITPGISTSSSRGSSALFRRRSAYCYRSPTEKILIELGRFLDFAVPNMPRRYATPALWGALAGTCPPREFVLDRWRWHTRLCADSQDVVRRARIARMLGLLATAIALIWRKPCLKAAMLVVMGSGLAFAAHRLEREFSFKYDNKKRNSDLTRIPKGFADERLRSR
ncbi:unnamed protein product [Polarella glacialis]|nr:unnamed protein product [Polarella glacialis]